MITKQLWQNEIDKSNLIECDLNTLIEIRDYFDYQWIHVYPGMDDDSDRAMFDNEDNLIGYMESYGKSYIAPHILELPRPPKPGPKPGTSLWYINKYLGQAFDNVMKEDSLNGLSEYKINMKGDQIMNNLAEVRKAHNMTLQQLADKLGLTRACVSFYEQHKLSYKSAVKIGLILGENPFKILGADALAGLPTTDEDKEILIETIRGL